MNILSAGISDVGKKREINEDSLLLDGGMGIYVVADGIGGQDDGEMASRRALLSVYECLKEALKGKEGSKQSVAAMERLLRRAIGIAAKEIFQLAETENGMGTTLTALLVVRGKGIMAHVGDSRLYVHRGGVMHQLSRDHTWAQEMIRGQKMRSKVANNHPMANLLTRALGLEETVLIDTRTFSLKAGDIYLLCTDGLTGHVTDDELATLLGSTDDMKNLSERLVSMANERGGLDNITVVLVRVEDPREDAVANPMTVGEPRIPTLVERDKKPRREDEGLVLNKMTSMNLTVEPDADPDEPQDAPPASEDS